MSNSLVVPFLDRSQRFARGVEFGMSVAAKMLAGDDEIRGYFLSGNEEQIRLAAHRLGYDVNELKPWRYEGKRTGWVWMVLVRRDLAEA